VTAISEDVMKKKMHRPFGAKNAPEDDRFRGTALTES
jgi:hypothetical protein